MIPTTPNSTVPLDIDEIPPIEVFYSPNHKDILEKEKKGDKGG